MNDPKQDMTVFVHLAQKGVDLKFHDLRNNWALKAPEPSSEQIEFEAKLDRNENPHNEPNKTKIRSKNEIISDLAYKFADNILENQFGKMYQAWAEWEGLYPDKRGARRWNKT